MTNEEETLAVITISTDTGTQIMLFTEEAGFQVYFGLHLKDCGKFKVMQNQTFIEQRH